MNCALDTDCPFMYYCSDKLSCEHNPIFPLTWYPILIYILFPIGCGLVNISGKSMGILKVLLLMNLLRYNTSDSTTLIQPMVAGAALFNIIHVIWKKHPFRKTTVIDYDIILIIIPSSLLGSTQGAIFENFIPEIIKDFLTIGFFAFFSYQFYQKAKEFKSKSHISQLTDSIISISNYQQESLILTEHESEQKSKILKYQQTIHLSDIALSILVFIIFQFLVFLVSGKFDFYSSPKCSSQRTIGLIVLTIVKIGYIAIIRKKLSNKHKLYKKIGIETNVDFSINKNFRYVCLGGYFAGFVQGILGVGSGTVIMGTMIALKLHPKVAAATSGYQIFFIGMSAFVQEYATNNISLDDALFLFLLTAVGGGAVTMLFYHFLKRLPDEKVKPLILFTMFGLCMVSTIFMVPFMIESVIDFGWSSLLKIKSYC